MAKTNEVLARAYELHYGIKSRLLHLVGCCDISFDGLTVRVWEVQ